MDAVGAVREYAATHVVDLFINGVYGRIGAADPTNDPAARREVYRGLVSSFCSALQSERTYFNVRATLIGVVRSRLGCNDDAACELLVLPAVPDKYRRVVTSAIRDTMVDKIVTAVFCGVAALVTSPSVLSQVVGPARSKLNVQALQDEAVNLLRSEQETLFSAFLRSPRNMQASGTERADLHRALSEARRRADKVEGKLADMSAELEEMSGIASALHVQLESSKQREVLLRNMLDRVAKKGGGPTGGGGSVLEPPALVAPRAPQPAHQPAPQPASEVAPQPSAPDMALMLPSSVLNAIDDDSMLQGPAVPNTWMYSGE